MKAHATGTVTSLALAREDRQRARHKHQVETIMDSMPPEDLHTLQYDTLSRPKGSLLPACLQDDFREWLRDGYNPIERETAMAPEFQGETEVRFLEESLESDDPRLMAMASEILARGRLEPRAIEELPAPSNC